MSPTARTLKHCRELGWVADVVERFIPGARVRRDLFGFIDVVILDGKPGVLGVQACSTGDQSTRLAKIGQEPRAGLWLAAGNRVQVWGWAKRGPRGKRKLWELTMTDWCPGANAPRAPEPQG